MGGIYINIFKIFLTISVFASAQFAFTQDYVIRSWDLQSGLKSNTVNTLIQSKSGYIWIGTPDGLVRFDGIRFSHFNHWNTPELQSDYISCLFEDVYGNLWIGTKGGGLYRYKNNLWQHFSTKNGLADNYINALINDWEGRLWVGTDNGLHYYDMDHWNILSTADGLPDNIITCIEKDPQGMLWIGTFRNGLIHYDQGIVRVYGYSDGLPNLSIYSLRADPKGNIWIGTREGLFLLNRRTDRIQYIPETASTPITDFLLDDHLNMQIATMSDGLKKTGILNEKKSVMPSFISDIYIRCLLTDRSGNLWAGTDANGLIQFKKSYIAMITRRNGLPENIVNTVLRDRHGDLWVGLHTGGLFKIRKEQDKTYTVVTEIKSLRVTVLMEDSAGIIWVGTEKNGVYRIIENKIEYFNTYLNLESQNVRTLVQDDENRLWIGTDSSLFYIKNKREQKVISPEENSLKTIQILYLSPSGTLYACYGKNVYAYINEEFVKTASLTDDVRCLYEDHSRNLWIGLRQSGLCRLSDGEYLYLTTDNGLPHDDILSIREDDNGNLWLSSPRGIIRIDKKSLNNFFDKHRTFVTAALFNEADGMINSRCSSTGYPVVTNNPARDKFWYATAGGIVVVDLQNLPDPEFRPIPHIEELGSGETILEFGENGLVEFTGDNIRIGFTAFDYSAPEKLYFRYRLTGLDTAYKPLFPGQERIARFNDLSSGDYVFVLLAANRFGEWNPVSKQIQIRIDRPFYTSLYFYLISVSLISVFAAALIYVRLRRNAKKQSEKYKTVIIPAHAAELTLKKLDQLMQVEKIYLDPDLSLSSLARRLFVHTNQLSRLINEKYGQNFNDYINTFRIQEAQRILRDPDKCDKKILEVIFESGFYSKSVFNTAFKKITGQTPSDYRRSQST